MKRFFTIYVVALICLLSVGCTQSNGSVKNEPITFAEFVEKYKRADFNEFMESPDAFIEDLSLTEKSSCSPDEEAEIFNNWEKHTIGETGLYYYIQEGILFNQPVIFNGNLYHNGKEGCYYSVQFDTSDPYQNFELSKILFEQCIKKYGDPYRITIDMEEVSEAELRKVLSSELENISFMVYWANKDGSTHLVSFECSLLGTKQTISNVSIH